MASSPSSVAPLPAFAPDACSCARSWPDRPPGSIVFSRRTTALSRLDWPATLAVAGWRFDDVISFDQILRMAYHQRTLNFVPGAEYSYSNTGYNLLAEMVARVTG